jgi:hypothetical protein
MNALAPRRGSVIVQAQVAFGWNRHCEKRSDEAIQRTWAPYVPLDCFASLAMMIAVRPNAKSDPEIAPHPLGIA